jgi:hypothetical protein
MPAQTIRLVGDTQRAFAKQCIDEAPAGHVVKIAAETRRDAQNRRLWAQIRDLQDQVPELAQHSPDDVKCQFMHALGIELRFLPALEGEGFFPVGFSSSRLTVQQFAGLLELINAYGARHGVKWSEPLE